MTSKTNIMPWIMLFIFILVLALTSLSLIRMNNGFFQEDNFCRTQGYTHHSFYGGYTEKFGKVECVSCYKGDCEYEEFKVKETFMKGLVEK